MLRLLRYLKPFLPQVLAIVVLLFIQANADLALPDYMSRIVNVGIQQGGVESVIPEALRRSTLERLALFLTPAEQADLQSQYRLVDRSSPDYAAYLQRYPALDREPIYVLRGGPAALESLRPALARALLIVFGIEQLQAHPEQAQALMPGWSGFDLSQLPPGTDLFAFLSRLPAEQRAQVGAAVDRRFAALGGERALLQAAARAVRAEYQALGIDMLQVQNTYLLGVGGQMLLITMLSAVATITVGFLAARTAAGLARNLRHLFFAQVMSFSGVELDRFSTASLITRSTNDITQIQTVMVFLLRMLFFAPLIGIGGVIRALSKSPSMWWTIALAVLVLVGTMALIFYITLPRFRLIQDLVDRLNRIARENLSGMMVVRAFNRQKHEEERFDRANRDLARTSLFVNRVSLIMMPGMTLLMNGLTILIIWIGSHQVAQSTLQIGDMMAFMQYAIQIVFAFSMLSMLFVMLPRVDVAANRVAEVLETEVAIRDPEHPRPFPEPFEASIEFRHVSFRYPGAEECVLHDISFTIPAGQTVGIIGTTGSGKSTLVNLIPRFYDVTEGAVYIGGMDVRRVRLSDLRDRIGYVPQQSNLFSGTVESNLRYAEEGADEETMRLALEIAQADDFILARPEGLEAEVSQGGVNFSGGQKQRLSIARALVKRPLIYIFDDSFSSLDYKTDARLRRALRKYVAGSTVIIVSQRVATIKDADQILVLDEGRLIGQGTHEELLERCAVYREIACSQLKLQEVLV
ncbi:MAG: ABC transporter ATP-binding protein [Chloroflexia bacterium]